MEKCLAKVGFVDHRVTCIIGCNPNERITEQDVLISVTVTCDISNAVSEDRVDHTVDYSKMVHQVTQIAKQGKFLLIETMAAHCLNELVKSYPTIEHIQVTVRKCLSYQPFVTLEKTINK